MTDIIRLIFDSTFAILFCLEVKRNYNGYYENNNKQRNAWAALIAAGVSAIIKYVFPLFKKTTFSSGAYQLGEEYRRNVLGESTSSSKAKDVGDEAVIAARNIFTAGFGILVGSRDHLEYIIKNDYQGYKNKFAHEFPNYKFTEAQFNRAVTLQKLYFPLQSSPPKFIWDLENFDKLPYLGPIPDPDNANELMNQVFPGDVVVKDGYFVNPTVSQKVAQDMLMNAGINENISINKNENSGINMNASVWLLGAAALGFFLMNRKK